MNYYSNSKPKESFTLTFLGFCRNFQNTCFLEHFETGASMCVKRKHLENYIRGKSQIISLRLFSGT